MKRLAHFTGSSNPSWTRLKRSLALLALATCGALLPLDAIAAGKEVVYLTAKADLPFWDTMGKGIKQVVEENGYVFREMDSKLSGETQLKNAQEAIREGVAGIVISPTNSKTAQEVLDVALKAKVPVVISDIGTSGGEYVTYVKSDNYRGAYEIGSALAAVMKEKGWTAGPFSQITIELARKNGQDRTNGFRDAMKDGGISNESPLKQMQDYSADETYRYVKDMLAATPNLHGLFIETDQPVEGAMRAIKEAKKTKQLLIVSFDAMPRVAELLNSGELVAVGMQQPYLMGSTAAEALISSIHGKTPAKQILVPILVATGKNINQLLPVANKTVFGIGTK